MPKPTAVAIYARISDDPEGREAGVTRQVDDCRELVEARGWTLADYEPFIDNDISASTLSKKPRPKYDELMRLVRNGVVDGVAYYTNGRLTRRPREYEDWIELHLQTGVALASVKSVDADLSTADGRMIARVLAAQDAAEAERISERVKRANVQRRAQGRPEPSSRAFGFEAGGEVVREAEADLIREAARRITDEGWSLGQVARDWNARGVKTVRGAGAWSRVQVARALLNPRTAGLMALHGKVLGPGNFAAILTPGLQAQVKEAAAGRRNGNTVTFKQRNHVLAGFLVCGRCARPMKVNGLYDADGNYRKDSFVVCSRSQYGCGGVKRNLRHLESHIDGVVRARLEAASVMGTEVPEDAAAEAETVEARLSEINEDIDALEADFNAGRIRYKDYNATLSTLRGQQEAAERTLGELQARSAVDPNLDLQTAWSAGTVAERREVLARLIDHITLNPIGKVGPTRALALLPETTIVTPR